MSQPVLREASRADHDAVRELCAAVWPDRDIEYLDRIFPEWVEGERKHTLVATEDDRVIGINQCVLLSDREAWLQGMRVHPDARGDGVGSSLVERLVSWARDQGAIVARNLVYSWNTAGMGHSRALGFEPATSFRWARPTPVDGPVPDTVREDGRLAWQAWIGSDHRAWFEGLSFDREESWALSECTPGALAGEGASLALVQDGLAGMAARGRQYEHESEETTGLEYATAAWRDPEAAETLFAAIARDAAREGVDEVRVPIPETPQHVSDVSACRVPLDNEPHFVFEMDLLDDS